MTWKEFSTVAIVHFWIERGPHYVSLPSTRIEEGLLPDHGIVRVQRNMHADLASVVPDGPRPSQDPDGLRLSQVGDPYSVGEDMDREPTEVRRDLNDCIKDNWISSVMTMVWSNVGMISVNIRYE